MNALRHFIRKLLLILNIILLLIFIFTCYAVPQMPPGDHWPLGLLGLAFPFLLLLVLAFIFFWLIFYFKYCLFGIAALLICWKFVSVFFAFHPFGGKTGDDDPDQITVMSYNVHYFKNFDSTEEANRRLRNKIMTLIKGQKPDILCLQEFYTSENPNDFDNKAYISKRMGLPYRYFSSDHNYENNHSGVIIFSRYPIINAAKVDLLKNNNKEIAIYADIEKDRDTFRIFTMHLQSIYLTHDDMKDLEKIKLREDTGLVASKKIIRKLHTAFSKRGAQAQVLSAEIRKSPYPVMVCGDFNDPPNSYTYFKVKGNLKDAFLERGFGIGRTYSRISPTLRIDFIFTARAFETESFKVIHKTLSDHFPVIAQLKYQAGSR